MAFMAQPWKDPRSGIYYIRRRVPKDVKPHLPQFGEFFKRSLETTCPQDAKVRFAAEWVKSQELFDLALRQAHADLTGEYTLLPADAPKLADRWVAAELAAWERDNNLIHLFLACSGGDVVTPLDVIDEECPSLQAFLADAMRKTLATFGQAVPPSSASTHAALQREFFLAWQTLCKTALQRHHGDWRTSPDLPAASLPLSQERTSRGHTSKGLRLSEVFASWCQWTRDTDGEGRDILKRIQEYGPTIQRFIELHGDLPVEDIRRVTVQEFHSQLRRMPSKGAGIRSMTALEQIAKANAEDLPRLSTARVKNRLMHLSSILSYAVRMELMVENPVTASGITKQLAKATNKAGRRSKRLYYEQGELIRIFSSPIYTSGWRSPRAAFGEAWFWLPLLLCYTGARREELAQLQVGEVRESAEGVWHLSLLATPDEDDADLDRTVKTLGSHRVVALHPDVIELGFLKYVRSLPAKGQLFPGLTPNPGGWYGHNFGKRWSEYLKKIAGLVTPAAPSHGFRHAFKTMCREAGVPEEIHDAITGHDDGRVSRKYGDRQLLTVQAEHLKRLPSIARLAGLLSS